MVFSDKDNILIKTNKYTQNTVVYIEELKSVHLKCNLFARFPYLLNICINLNFYRASICEGGLGSRNSVRPSVCLSVTCVDCDKCKWCTADIFIPHKRAITLLLWYQEWLVGDALFPVKSALKVTHPFAKPGLRPISAHNVSTVGDSEKSSFMTNIKSTTGFPTSHRWSAYVTPKCPKGWPKEQFLRILSKSQRLIISSTVNLVHRSVS